MRNAPEGENGTHCGRVTLVGAGPGDPGLLTLAGSKALAAADVVVTDRLVPRELLEGIKARVIDVGKTPRGLSTSQGRINEILVQEAMAGNHVVRFKGGDGFVFGRGGEELEACTTLGIAVEVIPGVSSSIAGPASARIPVTHRGLTQGFCVVSGHLPPGDPRCTTDFTALARSGLTIVVMMGVENLGAITHELCTAGADPATPAAVIADAGLPTQTVVRSDLSDVARAARYARIKPPAVTVIGTVAGLDLNS